MATIFSNGIYLFSADYMYRVTETDDLPVECVGSWSCWYGHQDTVGMLFYLVYM